MDGSNKCWIFSQETAVQQRCENEGPVQRRPAYKYFKVVAERMKETGCVSESEHAHLHAH